ncbi:MAG TPA: class I SAM-dependent methyltransferase [Shinella sp.]|jgi:SAM-dependent methyltransferase|uniref:class I SAM-dependent methyltransferase n=1 Tax=Shinella sp. TaxID=1870904 RepID=UPI002E165B7A|nr:class I SAM-dependent methyltransferase [Shinella sp.]
MNDWTHGYVSDIEYLPGFYAEQTPAHLDVACLLRGVEPPVEEGAPFAYCELGCGVGETALTIAAANPQSSVWGFDFNPAHIARGRALAEAGGVGNIRLEEASFEDLADGGYAGLPMFDYIALHGVWSWVSPENRGHIVRFAARYLKPGGLLYVTYNALPRWTPSTPMQRLVSLAASLDNDRSDRRVLRGLDMARAFSAAGADMISIDMLDRLDKERAESTAYLSHEYLNAHWSPCYQIDVAGDLAEAKLSFVATANLFENYPDLSMTAEQRSLVEGFPAAYAETARDFFLVRSFRRDVYMRGARPIAPRRLERRLAARRLCLVVPPSEIKLAVKVPVGEATLNESFYRPALDALVERPMTIGELRSLPEADGSSATEREVLGMLIGARQAMALPNAVSEEGVASVRRYNRAHLRICADEGRAVCALAAAGLGSGITVRLFEMLAYEVLVDGAEPEVGAVTAAIHALLQERGDRLRDGGVPIEDEAQALRVIRENVELVLAIALPMWRRVGAI